VEAVAGTPPHNTNESPPKPATRTSPRVSWNEQLEHLYGSWHRRVAAAEVGHRQMSGRMQRRYLLLGLPVVVLTTIVGTSVFASLQDAKVSISVRVIVGSISIIAAVFSSLQTFLRYSTRGEGHRIAAIRYETLRRDMAKTLALPATARPDPSNELDSVRTRMDRYAKESPMIGERQWEKLAPRFGLSMVPPDPRGPNDTITVPEPDPVPVAEPDPVPLADAEQTEGGTDGR
jgi:hypothetical protein